MLVAHPGGPGFGGSVMGDLGGLDEHFELILLDPRGTGGSDRPSDGSYELDEYVADVEDLLDHLDRRPSMLLGHSHGGLVALLYASARVDAVDHLVVMDTPSHVDGALVAALGDSDHVVELGSSNEDDEPRGLFRLGPAVDGDTSMISWGIPTVTYEPALEEETIEYDPLAYFNDHVIDHFDLRPLLPRITTPTLIVCGRDDAVAGPTACYELATSLPDAQLAVIEGSGHVPFLENRPAFRQAVLAYAESVGLDHR